MLLCAAVGCLSVCLGTEHRLRAAVQQMLTEVLGLEQEELHEDGGKLHKERLNVFYVYSSPNIIKVKVNVKQCRYRPGVAQRVPGS
jgi:hypothetical protein